MNRRDWHWAKHILHRRCEWCYQSGYQAGWLRHRQQQEDRERLRREEGLPPRGDQLEDWIRGRGAA